ncbi:hypothetical protein JRW51_01220 [Mycoplasma sp. SG1]|nr:hypothetical protein JRW51_01220 [Mycoplasma sp. SG1]
MKNYRRNFRWCNWECFDKLAVVLGLNYPWGENFEKFTTNGSLKFTFSLPKNIDFNFSYSGLKTEFLKQIKTIDENEKVNLAYSFQHYAFLQVILNLKKVILKYKPVNLFIGGGVTQNKYFQNFIKKELQNMNINFYFPLNKYCSDNAGMIGYLAWLKINKLIQLD